MSRFKLPQKITYWMPTANNGTGGKTWAAGITIAARIAPVDETVFTPEGKEQKATKAIYSRTDIPVGAYVIEGTHAGTTPATGAQLVIKSASNTTMTDMNRVLL